MDAAAVLTDMASRPLDSLGYLPQLSVEQANTHLADHPNSVAWLLWHTGRMAATGVRTCALRILNINHQV